MNAHDCAIVVKILYEADPFNWPVERIHSWGNSLGVGNYELFIAQRTSEAMVREVEPRDWSVPRWIAMYHAIAGPRKETVQSTGLPDEELITLGEHLARLKRSTDPQDATELDIWRRNGAYAQALAKTGTHAPRTQRARCSLCDGTGWEPTTEEVNGQTVAAVAPCMCSRGKERREVNSSILEANGAR